MEAADRRAEDHNTQRTTRNNAVDPPTAARELRPPRPGRALARIARHTSL
jgi:hypothetical protein